MSALLHCVYKRKFDGIYIINLKKTWEKLLFAARAIAAIENPADICSSGRQPNFAALNRGRQLSIFGMATIRLGTGPHF